MVWVDGCVASGSGSCVITSTPRFVLAAWLGDKHLALVLTERWANTAVTGESSPFQSDAQTSKNMYTRMSI